MMLFCPVRGYKLGSIRRKVPKKKECRLVDRTRRAHGFSKAAARVCVYRVKDLGTSTNTYKIYTETKIALIFFRMTLFGFKVSFILKRTNFD